MFNSTELKNYLATAQTVSTESLVLAEWNLNLSENIQVVGNYRYRPNSSDTTYGTIRATFSEETKDSQPKYYFGATDSDVTIDGGIDENAEPILFLKSYKRVKNLFSLEDCLNRFRPRSGINKIMWLDPVSQGSRFFAQTDASMYQRPRYYIASRDDKFKYWTSYREEFDSTVNKEVPRGFANKDSSGTYYIDDAAPFVVYRQQVPTNKIVVKIQTNASTIPVSAEGTFTNELDQKKYPDPFFADPANGNRTNMTVPKLWRVEGLYGDNWRTLKSNDVENLDLTLDHTSVGTDGYLELLYGLSNVPTKFKTNFRIAGVLSSESARPEKSILGYAYLVKENANSRGVFHVFNELGAYETFTPSYSWRVGNQDITADNQYVVDLTSPDSFVNGSETVYREFQYIRGLRIVVTSMNKKNTTFDLIEMSPRLSVDLSDRIREFELNKIASDIGNSGLPVGQLLVSGGQLSIFDYDQAFNSNNTNSIVSKFASKNLQIKFYDIVVNANGSDYYVPLKTMYSDGFQDSSSTDRTLSIELRDLFLYFESMIAPQILFQNTSLSMAIALLLDSIGFSNYIFKRDPSKPDPVIPYFFIAPNTSVAQVLNDLATSTQSAMFFDEYNNFVVMTKEYMIPESTFRGVDLTIYGSESGSNLANIIDVASKNSEVYNDGKITYSSRYIQKSVTSLNQASQLDEDRVYNYQPALLWEVAPSENVKSQNDVTASQSAYALTAIPLDSSLSADPPKVEDRAIKNNYISLGTAVYWVPRYNGYLYANGEIIRFDAIEYAAPQKSYTGFVGTLSESNTLTVTGGNLSNLHIGDRVQKINGAGNPGINATIKSITISNDRSVATVILDTEHISLGSIEFTSTPTPLVWVTSVEQYQDLFSKIPFGGKLYPTGRVRIYAEPDYELVSGNYVLKNGAIAAEKHGRGQFGTKIANHPAGILEEWTKTDNHKTIYMESDHIFKEGTIPATITGKAGVSTIKPSVGGIISNSLSSKPTQEGADGSLKFDKENPSGSVQSSALNMRGAYFGSGKEPLDYVSYVHKDVVAINENAPKVFGTRLRIIGKTQSGDQKQTANGTSTYYERTVSELDPITKKPVDVKVNVGGGSGGISILLDPVTNNGYFFEIIALSDSSLVFSDKQDAINNVLFYKVKRHNKSGIKDDSQAIPELLWSGLAPINVDNGKFTGQSRVMAEENPSVYDLAIEYSSNDKTKTFDLYINGKVVATVTDKDSLPDNADKNRFSSSPTPNPSSIGLFVRGSSNVMFEHVYTLSENAEFGINKNTEEVDRARSIMNKSKPSLEVAENDQFNRYTIPGPIRKSYVSEINIGTEPQYDIYYEEFGTIMRECAYFNVRYDKAYPALHAIISPTFNSMAGYSISGFTPTPYGAEFLIFNVTDSVLSLDSASGNYLRIQGITFTQESQHDLTVDEFFKKRSTFSNPVYDGNSLINPQELKNYMDIKNSRTTYGLKAFSLEPKYIQSQDAAESMMKWIIDLVSKPRKSVGLKLFSNPMIQLGDIVSINFQSGNFAEISTSRFVVYHVTYSRSAEGPSMTLYLSEVLK